jgi:hypothetical protein
MTTQKINTRNIVLVLMIVAAAATRLITYKLALKYPFEMSNVNTIGAIALFGGAYFTDKWKAFIVPFLALFLSDVALHYIYGVNWNSIVVYLCFAVMVVIGTLIKKVNVVNVLLASLCAVALHWLVTDLPWFYGTLYPHTLAGYIQSLNAAVLFERNMLIGDAMFCAILFGGFELAKSKYTFLRGRNELAI